MKVTRKFVPFSLEIENEADITLLLTVLNAAERYAEGNWCFHRKKESLLQDIQYLRNKLKGT